MSRTGASTSRTSTSRTKNAGRKPAAKTSARPKPATPKDKAGRIKPAPKSPTPRHEIRKRESGADGRTATSIARREKTAPPATHSPTPMKSADDMKSMKKAISEKPKIVKEEKEKRKSLKREISSALPAIVDQPNAKPAPAVKEPKVKVPKIEAVVPPEEIAAELDTPRRKRRSKSDPAPEPRGKPGRPPRAKSFTFDDELIKDFVSDEESSDEVLDDELAMEPMELPLELLDPELVEVPRPSPPPKPKPVTSRRQQRCASCGNTFAWLSVEQLCFNCLKKKLSQRKREDESYPGFTGEAEEEEESS